MMPRERVDREIAKCGLSVSGRAVQSSLYASRRSLIAAKAADFKISHIRSGKSRAPIQIRRGHHIAVAQRSLRRGKYDVLTWTNSMDVQKSVHRLPPLFNLPRTAIKDDLAHRKLQVTSLNEPNLVRQIRSPCRISDVRKLCRSTASSGCWRTTFGVRRRYLIGFRRRRIAQRNPGPIAAAAYDLSDGKRRRTDRQPTRCRFSRRLNPPVRIPCIYGPDTFCKLIVLKGNGLHACIRLAHGQLPNHARSLDKIRAPLS